MSKKTWLRRTRAAAAVELAALGVVLETRAEMCARLNKRRAGRARRHPRHRVGYEVEQHEARRRARTLQRLALRAEQRQHRREGEALQRECRQALRQRAPALLRQASAWLPGDTLAKVRALEGSGSMVDRAIALGLRDDALATQQQQRQRREWLREFARCAHAVDRGEYMAADVAADRLAIEAEQINRTPPRARVRIR